MVWVKWRQNITDEVLASYLQHISHHTVENTEKWYLETHHRGSRSANKYAAESFVLWIAHKKHTKLLLQRHLIHCSVAKSDRCWMWRLKRHVTWRYLDIGKWYNSTLTIESPTSCWKEKEWTEWHENGSMIFVVWAWSYVFVVMSFLVGSLCYFIVITSFISTSSFFLCHRDIITAQSSSISLAWSSKRTHGRSFCHVRILSYIRDMNSIGIKQHL